jgi:hypothetical protein
MNKYLIAGIVTAACLIFFGVVIFLQINKKPANSVTPVTPVTHVTPVTPVTPVDDY